MLENPTVFVSSPVLFCSKGSCPSSFSYVRIFTLFIGTFVVVDEITQVLCIDLIFDDLFESFVPVWTTRDAMLDGRFFVNVF